MSTSLADWKGAPAPTAQLIEGRFIRLEKLDPARHTDSLWQALQGPGADPKLWDYLPYGPFTERAVFDAWLNNHAANSDPYFFSVIDRASGDVQGILSLMSIVPAQGRIEIGHVTFGAPMQRSPKAPRPCICWPGTRLSWATGAWNGSATTVTPAPNTQPSAWGSVLKGCSASIWWSRGRTATRRGTRSSMENGRRSAPGLRPGLARLTRRPMDRRKP